MSDDLEFDFVEAYDDEPSDDGRLLPDNDAISALNVGFLGIGGGGGKVAKAFLDLGFNKTILINTTEKDQPAGVEENHFLLIPGADGVGKDIKMGKRILSENSAMIEDAVRTRFGKIDWLFVFAGGGGGTGSACSVLHSSLERFLESIESDGKVVFFITKPTAQEMLNPTIKKNYKAIVSDIAETPHMIIDNERQLQILRGKVGVSGLYPTANRNFAKMVAQVLKLAETHSEIQTFDSKDLEKTLSTKGRMILGSTVIRDPGVQDLGSALFQGCLKASPCTTFAGSPEDGVLLLILDEEMADDPSVSSNIEAAFSYVGGRSKRLFSGVYVNDGVPGLVAILLFAGLK
jgi:cell division GTPase FtsZ